MPPPEHAVHPLYRIGGAFYQNAIPLPKKNANPTDTPQAESICRNPPGDHFPFSGSCCLGGVSSGLTSAVWSVPVSDVVAVVVPSCEEVPACHIVSSGLFRRESLELLLLLYSSASAIVTIETSHKILP